MFGAFVGLLFFCCDCARPVPFGARIYCGLRFAGGERRLALVTEGDEIGFE